MKIAHIINYFQPKLGYQETYLAKEQLKLGHEVAVFTSDRYVKFKDYEKVYGNILGPRFVGSGEFEEEGIKVFRHKPLIEFKGKILFKNNLFQNLFEYKPDFIIVHGVLTFAAIQLALRKKHKIPIIYDDHVGGLYKINGIQRIYYYMFSLLFKKSIENSAMGIIGVTNASKSFLTNHLGFDKKKVSFIPLGIDNTVFRKDISKRIEIRRKLQISDTCVLGIYTGKLQDDKGIGPLIDALIRIFNEFEDFRFIFIGNGDKSLINRINTELKGPHVFHFKFMDHQNLSSYFSASDFAIWPKKGSISQFEAMACGNALIIPEIRKERIQGNNGISLKIGDADEIYEVIKTLIIDRELLAVFKENSLKFAENFSWEKINNQFMSYAK